MFDQMLLNAFKMFPHNVYVTSVDEWRIQDLLVDGLVPPFSRAAPSRVLDQESRGHRRRKIFLNRSDARM